MRFDENLEELDKILKSLEEGQLPLDEALSMFERGVVLIRESRKFLNETEQKVTLLTQDGKEAPFVRAQGHVKGE
jgi:exodeoxyribonuclease VII small subunit